jgi:dTDP-4-amino-4,6-dideoxygalactose transaminase
VSMHTIPVMRPMLPAAERLLPYLKQIDAARVYSNFGPLALSLERRLAAHFDLPETAVVTVANATLGLALALLAQQARPGTLCLLPGWTFIASAHAVRLAGLVPYFVDVDARTWAIDAASTVDLISHAPAQVGAVMPVVPFGQPIDLAAWDRFRASTGIPVVIDAAAGFDSLVPSETPAVVSLHATKTLGVGEGGFVMSADESLIREIRTRANFGFYAARTATVPAMNAKLSEYHAAVGLVALDEWPQARAEWAAAAGAYRRALPESNRVRFQNGFGESWISSTCNLSFADIDARQVEGALANARIDSRSWWGPGAHAHPATAACPRAPLLATERLVHSTTGVPLFRDMTAGDVGRVVDCILAVEAL